VIQLRRRANIRLRLSGRPEVSGRRLSLSGLRASGRPRVSGRLSGQLGGSTRLRRVRFCLKLGFALGYLRAIRCRLRLRLGGRRRNDIGPVRRRFGSLGLIRLIRLSRSF